MLKKEFVRHVLNVLVSVDSYEANYALQSHFREKFQNLDLVTICRHVTNLVVD